MAGDASAYAALGLEPGADAAAVERAYKRLIKQYHPDREGGDAGRAAEINRAYREIRGAPASDHELVFEEAEPDQGHRHGWARAALVLAVLMFALVFGAKPASRVIEPISQARGPQIAPTADRPDAMDQPLALAAVDGAVSEAVRISRNEDEMALSDASRDCQRLLRQKPTIEQLDRCAAFDDAVVQLQDRDPLRDQGPFSEIAVTGRQMSAATLFSDDYLAIDGRLGRIRGRVELALARMQTPAAPRQTSDQG